MSEHIDSAWRVFRRRNIDGGLTADPDWVTLGDMSGWQATSRAKWWEFTEVPQGRIELVASYFDANEVNTPPGLATALDFELVQRIKSKNASAPAFLAKWVSGTLTASDVWPLSVPSPFMTHVGIRLVSLNGQPAGSTRVAVHVRGV